MKLRLFDQSSELAVEENRPPATLPASGFAPQRVLITRLSAIGDCVLTLPLAVRIKELWPDCHLTWLVDCAAAQLLEDHPNIDRVIKIEKRWLAHPRRWSALRQQLQAEKFDIVFDPQGLTKSSLLGRLSGAKLRVGFDYSHARELAPLLANCRVHRTARHMVDTYLELLNPWCETPLGTGQFNMPVYSAESARIESLLGELGWRNAAAPSSIAKSSLGKPATPTASWIALNVGAGWPSKQWPPERLGRVAQEVFQRYGHHSLVLWAGQNEQALAEQAVAHSAGAAVMAPDTNLRELVELIRRATMLISADTAALQIASAVGTPCIGLFGPTWADEVGPYANQHASIQSCVLPDSERGMRRSSNASMNAIELSEVVHACHKLLAPAAQISSLRLCQAAA
ncbi:MAG: glycosyltransferase family 9 protein [Pirellulaceae bacterium]